MAEDYHNRFEAVFEVIDTRYVRLIEHNPALVHENAMTSETAVSLRGEGYGHFAAFAVRRQRIHFTKTA